MFKIPLFLTFGWFLLFQIEVAAQIWTLEKCLNYAQEHNAGLMVEESMVSTSLAEQKSAVSRLLPKIDGNAALDHYWKIPVQVFPGQLLGQPEGTFVPVRLGTPWMGSVGLEASVKLVDNESWKQIRLAALQTQLSESEVKSAKNNVLRNVHMAYLTAQLNQGHVISVSEQYRQYRESHQLLQLQFEKGLADKITLNQSEVILGNLESDIGKSTSDFMLAGFDLKFWMGYPMEDSLAIDTNLDASVWNSHSGGFHEALLPDYETYSLKADISRQQYTLARAAWYPRLALRSGYSRLGFGQDLGFIGNSKWFSSGFVGLKMTVPLLDLDQMIYEPRRQKNLLHTAELEGRDYNQRQKQLWLKEQVQLSQSLRSISTQEHSLKLALENQALSRRKLEKGVINGIELRQVQDELSQTRSRLIHAKLEYLKHYLTLHYLQN